jgi:hypothetical protein
MLHFVRDLTLVLVDRKYIMEADRTKVMNERPITFTVSQTTTWPSFPPRHAIRIVNSGGSSAGQTHSPTWDALLSLALFAHNWIRPHVALRRPLPEPIDGRRYARCSPAMALGLTGHLWPWEEFLRWPVRRQP